MSASEIRPGFVLKGWHVLVMILAFFGADIAVNTVFIVDAYKTFPGETSVTPYEDGLAYDKTAAQVRAQEALGWRIAASAGAGGLEVQALDRAGAPLRGLKVSGQLTRPATETGKTAVRFAETAPGVYSASAALTGAWDLTVTVSDSHGRSVVADRRLVLP
jgi:nitrogen fixation protein FixH